MVKDVLRVADQFPRRCGAILVVDDMNELKGIFTDSDLRRLLTHRGPEVVNLKISEVMTPDPVCVDEYAPVQDVIQVIRERRLDEVPVIDAARHPIGVLDVQDLLAMKLIKEH